MNAEALAAARRYLEAGLSLIPLKPRSKKPAISRWTQYQRRKPTNAELVDWFAETENNLGLVMGSVSGDAFALDFDNRELAAYFIGDLAALARTTFVQETAKGLHVVMRSSDGPVKSKSYKDRGLPLDVKGEGGYIVSAPSVHPDGPTYRVLSPEFKIASLASAPLVKRIEGGLADEWAILEAVRAHYSEGRRHEIALGLPAWLRRRGFGLARTKNLIGGLCRLTGDPELADRLRAVEDTYTKPDSEVSSAALGDDILNALPRLRVQEIGELPEPMMGDRNEAHEALGHHLRFSQEWHFDLVLLWAAQAHLREVLPDECCVNLAFSGPKSSGKSKGTEIAVRLAEGEMLAGGTLAAIIRTFDKAKVVGIDELDSNLRRVEDLEGILRVGNKWSAIYKICAPGKGGLQRPIDLHVGGPKAFNYRSDIEDALKSRTYVIEMPRQNDSRLIINNLFLENPTGRVTAWLRRICGAKVKAWTKAKVEAHMKDPAFIARLDALPAALARNRETAAIFLMVADVLGWELDSEMTEAARVQADEEISNEDVREILVAIYAERADPRGDLELPLRDVLTWVNERRKPSQPISGKAFARIRRECGFQDGLNVIKRSSESGKRFLIFDSTVRATLGISTLEKDAAAPELETAGGPSSFELSGERSEGEDTLPPWKRRELERMHRKMDP